MRTDNQYTFGDSDRAAERLYWLARTFDAGTLAFARAAVARAPAQASASAAEPLCCCVDLGAGPGFLTRTLHAGLQPTRTVGLEASARFVSFGSADLPSGIELLEHDVLQPLPIRGDLMVSRFLLTHLHNPQLALTGWLSSVRAPCLLLLEELAHMSSDLPALQQYYELVALVQRTAGQDMTIGLKLADLAQQAGWKVERHTVDRQQMPLATMGRLHALNLPTLRQQKVVTDTYSTSTLDALQSEIEQLARGAVDGFVRVDMARCEALAL